MDEELREAIRELAHVARSLLSDSDAPGSVLCALSAKIEFYAIRAEN
jgi:hypothetical protein